MSVADSSRLAPVSTATPYPSSTSTAIISGRRRFGRSASVGLLYTKGRAVARTSSSTCSTSSAGSVGARASSFTPTTTTPHQLVSGSTCILCRSCLAESERAAFRPGVTSYPHTNRYTVPTAIHRCGVRFAMSRRRPRTSRLKHGSTSSSFRPRQNTVAVRS